MDAHTWESTRLGGTWLDFPGERGIFLNLVDATQLVPGDPSTTINGEIYEVVVYISTSNHPDTDGTQFTIAGGNLAIIKNFPPTHVFVQNDTCADYFVKVVVHAEPRDAGVGDTGAVDSAADSAKD